MSIAVVRSNGNIVSPCSLEFIPNVVHMFLNVKWVILGHIFFRAVIILGLNCLSSICQVLNGARDLVHPQFLKIYLQTRTKRWTFSASVDCISAETLKPSDYLYVLCFQD